MALGSSHMTGSGGTHDAFVPEKWSKDAQLAVENLLVFKRLVKDLSAETKVINGDTLRIQKVSNLTPTSRSATTIAQVTPLVNTEGQLTMSINQRYVLPIAFDDAAKWQTYGLQIEDYKQKMVYGLAKQIDSSVSANYSGLSTNAAKGTLGIAPTDDAILDQVAALDSADCPQDERYLVLGPKSKRDLIAIPKYINQDYVRMAKMPVQTGLLGDLYGFATYWSNNIPLSSTSEVNLMFHRDAFAVGIQKDIFVEYSREATWTADVYVAQALWGTMIYRDAFAGAVYGR